jgi:hypothetical protein
MGVLICQKHGETVIEFVSKYHADKITNNEKCNIDEVFRVKIVDINGIFDGSFLVDKSLIEETQIDNFTVDVQTDLNKFEMLFDKLTPVCSECVKDYLKNK